MPLIVLGINHTTAPVELREKLAIADRELPESLASLANVKGISETAIISTCNRTELYAVVDYDIDSPDNLLAEFLSSYNSIPYPVFKDHLYTYIGEKAAQHLFAVAAGLDSMILGEPDIQRQVKQALEAMQNAGTGRTVLNRLFQDALVAGKKIRTETGIARGAQSIGSVAVDRAMQIFGESLEGCTVLVLGAGKMSEVTARHLQSHGAPAVLVANRTYEKAQELANQIGGVAKRFDELPQALISADIVVCSTAAPHPVVTRPMIKESMRLRHNRELFLIDIAVPRDVEPSVGDLDNVYLYNIDDLNQIVAGTRQLRAAEISQANVIIDSLVEEFMRWWCSLEVTPTVVALREKLAITRTAELARLRSRLSDLSDKEWQHIESAMEALTNKIAHPATKAIKQTANSFDAASELDTIRRAFGIEHAHGEKDTGTPQPENNLHNKNGSNGSGNQEHRPNMGLNGSYARKPGECPVHKEIK